MVWFYLEASDGELKVLVIIFHKYRVPKLIVNSLCLDEFLDDKNHKVTTSFSSYVQKNKGILF